MKLFKRVVSRKEAIIAVVVGCVIGLGLALYNHRDSILPDEPTVKPVPVKGAAEGSSGAGKFDPQWLKDDEGE